jgi:tetratricopeptide (TPR) repeat protein
MGEERLILPPPVHRRRESEILNEIPNVLGLVLWQDVRHLHAWADTCEALRPPADIFNPSPPTWVLAKHRDARAQCGELSDALGALQAVAAAPRSVDRTGVAHACRQVVDWALAHEHTQTAIEFAEAAARVDPKNPEMANLAGRVTRNAGEYARAEVWFNRGIGYAREQSNKLELTRGHLGYGTLCKLTGRVRDAQKHLNSGSRIARKHGSPSLAAEAQHDLCALLIERGHYPQAEEHAFVALRWYPKNHHRLPLFVADVALLFVLRRHFSAAVRLLRNTVRLLEAPGTKTAVLALYSRALAGAGHAEEATRQRRRVLHLLQRHSQWEALALWHLAAAERSLGHWESAEAHASRALEIATEKDDLETERRVGQTLSHILSRTPAPTQISRRTEEFRAFVESLTDRLSDWAPRRTRSRSPLWGDRWAA